MRKFVDILDLVKQYPEYEPDLAEKIELSAEEKELVTGDTSWLEGEDEEVEPVVI